MFSRNIIYTYNLWCCMIQVGNDFNSIPISILIFSPELGHIRKKINTFLQHLKNKILCRKLELGANSVKKKNKNEFIPTLKSLQNLYLLSLEDYRRLYCLVK